MYSNALTASILGRKDSSFRVGKESRKKKRRVESEEAVRFDSIRKAEADSACIYVHICTVITEPGRPFFLLGIFVAKSVFALAFHENFYKQRLFFAFFSRHFCPPPSPPPSARSVTRIADSTPAKEHFRLFFVARVSNRVD